MRVRRIFIGGARCFSHLQSGARNFEFTLFRAFTNALDHVAIAIARGEIHSRINLGRIFGQLWIDQAYFFKELFPIEGRQQPHAGDDVAYSNLGGRLPMMFFMNDLLERNSLFGQLLLEPFHRRHHARILVAQTLDQLYHECAARFLTRSREQRNQFLRLAGHFENLVGQSVSFVSFGTR